MHLMFKELLLGSYIQHSEPRTHGIVHIETLAIDCRECFSKSFVQSPGMFKCLTTIQFYGAVLQFSQSVIRIKNNSSNLQSVHKRELFLSVRFPVRIQDESHDTNWHCDFQFVREAG